MRQPLVTAVGELATSLSDAAVLRIVPVGASTWLASYLSSLVYAAVVADIGALPHCLSFRVHSVTAPIG